MPEESDVPNSGLPIQPGSTEEVRSALAGMRTQLAAAQKLFSTRRDIHNMSCSGSLIELLALEHAFKSWMT